MNERGTPPYMKYLNKKQVLKCIKENQPISRAEIAAILQFSKPTVSNLVEELLDEHWIYEKGSGESTDQGGRRPIQLFYNEKAKFVIGTDIGGTNVRTAIGDLNGNIIHMKTFSTINYLKADLLHQLHRVIQEMITESGLDEVDILGMGLGIPGMIDYDSGIVIEAPSLGWNKYQLLKEANKIFSFPIFIDNDVNVAALGEQWKGVGKNKKNLLFIAIGTGIGSGIIINNQLYRGATGAAGEIGYMVTDKKAVEKEFYPMFKGYGFFESVAGGKSIGKRMTDLIKADVDHQLHKEIEQREVTAKEVFQLASAGDDLALRVIEESNTHLGFGIINAACP